MEITAKLRVLDRQGVPFLGPGPAAILEGVRDQGSIHRAARTMNMSYTKALKVLAALEEGVGRPVLERATGGPGGGGSRLTPAGQEVLSAYRSWEERVRRFAAKNFPKPRIFRKKTT